MADAIEKGTYQGPTSSHYGDIGPAETPGQTGGDWSLKEASGDEDFEIFRSTADGVNFRTLSWMWASVIFLKSAFESALSLNAQLARLMNGLLTWACLPF